VAIVSILLLSLLKSCVRAHVVVVRF